LRASATPKPEFCMPTSMAIVRQHTASKPASLRLKPGKPCRPH
jgi:hypothetical protein